MHCRKCGKPMPDNAKFCPYCATENPSGWQNRNVGKERREVGKNGKRPAHSSVWIVVLSLLAAVVILVAAGGIYIWSSPAVELTRQMDRQLYDQAYQVYNSEIEKNSIQLKLADFLLKGNVSAVEEQYSGGAVTYVDAVAYLETLQKMRELEAADRASEVLSTLNAKENAYQAFEQAESCYYSGDYESAISYYKSVQEDTDYYEQAQSKLKDSMEKYKSQVLEKTAAPSTTEEYQTAINTVETALTLLPGDQQLTERQQQLESSYKQADKSEALEKATEELANDDYAAAFETLEEALKINPDDAELTKLLTSAQSEYEQYVIDRADSYMAAGNYTKAVSELNDGLKLLPDSAALQAKLKKVQEATPVSLASLTALNGNFPDWNDGVPEDPFGNTYNDAVNFLVFTDWYYYEKYAEYRLYGEYSSFSFTTAPYTDIYEDGTAVVHIYADDELIFTSDVITRKSDPKHYTVDLPDPEYLKIVVENGGGGKIILMSCTLMK